MLRTMDWLFPGKVTVHCGKLSPARLLSRRQAFPGKVTVHGGKLSPVIESIGKANTIKEG